MSEKPCIPAMILSGFLGAAAVIQVQDIRGGQIPIETTRQTCSTLLNGLTPDQKEAFTKNHHPIVLKCQAIVKALD